MTLILEKRQSQVIPYISIPQTSFYPPQACNSYKYPQRTFYEPNIMCNIIICSEIFMIVFHSSFNFRDLFCSNFFWLMFNDLCTMLKYTRIILCSSQSFDRRIIKLHFYTLRAFNCTHCTNKKSLDCTREYRWFSAFATPTNV